MEPRRIDRRLGDRVHRRVRWMRSREGAVTVLHVNEREQ